METLYYWLVEHPTIGQFDWKHGHTFGSSLFFPTLSIFIYLSLTLLALRFSLLLPTLSTTSLHRITVVHSLILCLLSLIMVVGCSLSVLDQMPRNDWKWLLCFPANHTLPRGPFFFWAKFFYLSKILEFIDTLLIILGSSKTRRLTFLHVYHHATTPVICYLALSNVNSMIHVGVITNSSVHVITYAYYFFCTTRKSLGWKKIVTNCQILQFVLYFIGAVVVIYYHLTTKIGCSGARTLFFNVTFNTSLFLFYLNFHSENYANNIIKHSQHKASQ